MPWTDALAEPLATVVAAGDWQLIHEARGGGWLLLPQESQDPHGWRHLSEDSLTLRALCPFDDPRLRGLAPTVAHFLRRGDSVELLAWRVGKRAVLRVRGAGQDRIVKVYRKDRSIVARWSAFPAIPGDRWRTPRVFDWHQRDVRLTAEFCQGVSLNDWWHSGHGNVDDADRISDLLAWIASRPADAQLEVHGADEETRTLQLRLETFERTLRAPPTRARRLVEIVADRLHAFEPGWLLCHRDLHDKQILFDGEQGRLIDLDLAAYGSPALDVGNILAHIHLRWLKGVALPWEELVGRIACAALRNRDLGDTLPVWTASTLLRLALIYSRRRREPGLIESLLDATESALAAAGPWRALR